MQWPVGLTAFGASIELLPDARPFLMSLPSFGVQLRWMRPRRSGCLPTSAPVSSLARLRYTDRVPAAIKKGQGLNIASQASQILFILGKNLSAPDCETNSQTRSIYLAGGRGHPARFNWLSSTFADGPRGVRADEPL